MTASTGLRALKKRQTRRLIAETAARLFADHGYEQVSVIEIARAAQLSEQTVYNYFPTKRELVLDRDEQLRDRLTELIRDRRAGENPARAIRDEALSMVHELRALDADQVRGGLGYLATVSPAVHRLSLEMTDRHADAIAEVLAAGPGAVQRSRAKLHGVALAWVFQTITDETGRGARAGRSPAQIADELEPVVAGILDDLERWPGAAPA